MEEIPTFQEIFGTFSGSTSTGFLASLKGMIIYLSGDDAFLAKRAIDQLKGRYRDKNGDAELAEIDCLEAEKSGRISSELANLQAVPLFASSRLVVIRQAGALTAENQTALARSLSSLPATTVAVVWPAKRPAKELEAVLKKAEKVISAQPYDESQTRKFIERRAKELGLTITSQTLGDLLNEYGNNLWGVENELIFLATSQISFARQGSERPSDQPYIYFNLVRQRAWAKIGRELTRDFAAGKPFELLLGSLASAVRKELRQNPQRQIVTELLGDIDFAVKTGLVEAENALTLLGYRLSNPALERVQWEQLYYETY